jgi:hypothetical protein
MREIPSVYNDRTVLEFLQKQAEFIRSSFGGGALKSWAESIGIKSRITFKKIVSGHKALKATEVDAIQKSLDMSHSERMIFNGKMKGPKVEKQYFVSEDFFASPLNTIVLNLCGINTSMNHEKIKSILRGAFTEAHIEEAIALLLSLELIQHQEDGSLKRMFEGAITTAPGVKSKTSQEYFQKSYQLANLAWAFPLEMREMQSFTFRIDSEDIPKLKDLVRNFRSSVSNLSSKETKDSVYQCSIAAFPIYLESEK